MGSSNRETILAAMSEASKAAVAQTLPPETAEALGLVIARADGNLVAECPSANGKHGTLSVHSFVAGGRSGTEKGTAQGAGSPSSAGG